MTMQPHLPGNAPGLPKAATENANAALWSIIDLCLAGRLILKNAPDGFQDTSEGVSLRAILDAIEGTADNAVPERGTTGMSNPHLFDPSYAPFLPFILEIHEQAVCIEGLFQSLDALRGTLGPSALAVEHLIVSGLSRAKQLSRALENAT